MNERGKFRLSDVKLDIKFVNLTSMFIYVMFFSFTFLSAYLRSVFLYITLFVWFFSALLIDVKWISRSKAFLMCLIGFVMLILIDDIMSSNSFETFNVFARSEIYFFAFMVMGVFYTRNYRKFDFRPMLAIVIAALVIGYVATYIGLVQFPSASRDLASGISENTWLYKKMGIGGFSFIYHSPYLLIVLFFFIGKLQSTWKNVLSIITIILISITVVKSDYTTVVLLILISLFMSALFMSNRNTQIKVVILIVAIFLVFIFRVQLLELVLKVFPDKTSTIYMRLQELLQSFTDSSITDFNRIERMLISLRSFIASPLIGEMGEVVKSIGGHSDIFDSFGKYGLLALIYHGIFISVAIYQYKKLNSKKAKTCFIIMHAVYLLARITNPLLAGQSVACMIYFICPMLLYDHDRRVVLNMNKVVYYEILTEENISR